MGGPLVSVIIPAFNAERWIREAIDSSLRQSWRNTEIIVIDDGSTDTTLDLLHTFRGAIRWRSVPHRNGNYARNIGFSLSKGEYVQFLDADDYLVPGKIETQVGFLELTGADVVYGDWRHQHHEDEGNVWVEDVVLSGDQPDVLQALLAGWWVAPCALLFRRQVVENIGGWDERLLAAQDRDFFIRIAQSGADIRYQRGCGSFYRRYGNVTVSTSKRRRWLEAHRIVLDKATANLSSSGLLKQQYKEAVAASYFVLARNYFDIDRDAYDELMANVLYLDPRFRPKESPMYNITQRIFGFGVAEQLARLKRRSVSQLSGTN